jgi:chlorite dismutase
METGARLFSFAGGDHGAWRVIGNRAIVGEPVPDVARLYIAAGVAGSAARATRWVLRGVTSHERYTTRDEKRALVARQPALGRAEATRAALIPIRKTPAWWGLAQDERRSIFEERSEHLRLGMRALPAVARRLHHSRDLGEACGFDFLTWFEYAPADADAFDRLVGALRATEEWRYVDREVEIRVMRGSP